MRKYLPSAIQLRYMKGHNVDSLKKGLTVVVILLFIGLAFAPSINASFDSKTSKEINNLLDRNIIFYGNASIEIERENRHWHLHREIHTQNKQYHFDADLDELVLEIIMNYSAEMNYTMNYPFVLAPLFAFGFGVQNYSDYKWMTFKLRHHGYDKRQGNISIEIEIDMENIEIGDEIRLIPSVCAISDPNIREDINYSWIWRFALNLPIVNRFLLYKWLFSIIIPDCQYYEGVYLQIFFD